MNDRTHFEHRWRGPDATREAGAALATCLEKGDEIGLVGDLGAGKTCLVQGIARGLSVPEELRITSPTFTLINEYHGGRFPLYHADLYRIEDDRELDEIGLDDMCRSGRGVVCVEWSDRFVILGRDHLQVRLGHIPGHEDERVVVFQGTGARSHALADAWNERLMA